MTPSVARLADCVSCLAQWRASFFDRLLPTKWWSMKRVKVTLSLVNSSQGVQQQTVFMSYHSKDLYSATPKYLRPLRSISYFEGTMLCTPNLWGSHVILHGLVNRRLVCSPASGVGHEGPEIPRLCLPFITVIDDLPISVIIL